MASTLVGVPACTAVSKAKVQPWHCPNNRWTILSESLLRLMFEYLVVSLRQMPFVCCVVCENESFQNFMESECGQRAMSSASSKANRMGAGQCRASTSRYLRLALQQCPPNHQ